MEIKVGNEILNSIDFSANETAWMITDAFKVLHYLKSENKIVLGGDILTEELEHNYDSWYYNVEPMRDLKFNIESSVNKAYKYISNYIEKNGNSFYVIFVSSRG